MADVPLPLDSQTVPSNSNSSEGLNCSSPLTNSLTHSLTNQLTTLTPRMAAISQQPPTLLTAISKLSSRVRLTLQLAFYHQSVCLGAKSLSHSPYVTSSLLRGWVYLLWIGFTFIKCAYCTYSMLLKILPCPLYASPLSVQALQSRSCLSYLSYATTAAW
jgi:hypothetical protein